MNSHPKIKREHNTVGETIEQVTWAMFDIQEYEGEDSEPSEGQECHIDGKTFKKYDGLLYEIINDIYEDLFY
jgi:hypothetical protein